MFERDVRDLYGMTLVTVFSMIILTCASILILHKNNGMFMTGDMIVADILIMVLIVMALFSIIWVVWQIVSDKLNVYLT